MPRFKAIEETTHINKKLSITEYPYVLQEMKTNYTKFKRLSWKKFEYVRLAIVCNNYQFLVSVNGEETWWLPSMEDQLADDWRSVK